MLAWLDSANKRSGTMPSLIGRNYIIDWLVGLGVWNNGKAFNYPDLTSWSSATGLTLNSWEVETLVKLSVIYTNYRSYYSDLSKPSPNETAEEKAARLEKLDKQARNSWN